MPGAKILVALIVMLSLIGGSNCYIAARVHRFLHTLLPGIPFGVYLALFLLLAVLMILGFIRSMLPLPAGIKNILGTVSLYWMGIFIYLLLFLVLTDLLSLPFGQKIRALAVPAALVCTAAVCCYGFFHATQLRQVDYDITLEDRTLEETRIVLISDVHLGALGSEKRLPKIVEQINELEPDLICISGDFFDSDFAAIHDPEEAARQIQRLRAKYGVYLCLGNHDAGSTFPQMLEFIDRCGIRLLSDDYEIIDGRLVLAGRLDGGPIGGYDGRTRGEFRSILPEDAAGNLPVVVLDHNPASVDSYGAEADLILSGHTHRGQIFPGSLITDRMYTVDYGYFHRDGLHVVVTSGVGTWGMPMRVGTDCEIVSIRLRGENA